MRTLVRWSLRLLLAVAVLAGLVLVTLLAGTRTPFVRDLLRRETVAQLERALHARVEIGAVGGSVLHTLFLDRVRVAVEGRTLVRIERIEVDYALRPLLGGELRLERVVLKRPEVRAVRRAGKWLLPMRPERPGPSAGGLEGRLALSIERLVIEDGRFAVALLDARPVRRFAATRLALEGSARLTRARQTFEVARLGFLPRGLPLSAVDASLAGSVERGGPLRVSRLEVATRRSRAAAAGTVAPGRELDARLTVAPLAAADLRAFVPEIGLVDDVRGRVHARGPWRAIAAAARADLGPGGTVVAHATVDAGAAPLDWSTRLRLAGVDPGAVVTRSPHAWLQGEARLDGRGFEVRGPLRYAVALENSRFEGREIRRLDLRGSAADGVHRVRGAFAAPLGEATFGARLGLDRPLRYQAKARYTVARLDLLVPSPSVWGWAMGQADLRGRGTTSDDRRARAAVAVTGASVSGLPVTRADLRARLAGTALDVERISLDSPVASLEGHGQADLERRSGDLVANGRADLGTTGAYLGQALAGRATVALAGQGPIRDLGAEMTVAVEQPAYGRISAGPTSARVRVHGLGGAAAGGEVHLEAKDVRNGTNAPWATQGDVAWTRQGKDDRAEISAGATSTDGRRQQVALNVVRSGERTSGELRELALSPPQGPAWRLSAPTRFTVDQAVTVERLVLEASDQRLTLTGRIALRQGTSDASLALDAIRLAPICATADLPPCAGRVSGRLALTGTAVAPVADLGLHAERLRVREVAYGVLDVSARAADTRATLQATLQHPDAGDVHVAGEVPVDFAWGRPRRDLSAAPVALTATATNLDLTVVSALAPRQVDAASGRLGFDLRVNGPLRAPRVAGDLAIDDGQLELVAVGMPYEKIRARLVADGTRIEVRELHAEAGEGTADATGTVDLPVGGPGAADVTLRLDEFYAVRRDAYEAVVSGAVAARGPLDAPEVTGAIDVERALVRPAALPASGPTVVKDPSIEVLDAPDLVPAEGTAALAQPALADPIRLAVTVTIAHNAWIRRNDADIEIAGELRVTKAPWEPVRINGQIRLVRGWYLFKGRRFTLQQGTITFEGTTPPNPSFDITAVHRAGEYTVEVRITGSADKPALALSSTPPLEQADILSVLLFGKPAQQLGRGQSAALQEQALQLAAGFVVPELRTSVMNALGVDTLEVELPQGSEQAGRISAGRYVAEDVFLSLAQELGPRAAQEVGIEYDVGRNVSVRGSTTTRGTSAVDLFWHYRY